MSKEAVGEEHQQRQKNTKSEIRKTYTAKENKYTCSKRLFKKL
jgi:hypothetical protein